MADIKLCKNCKHSTPMENQWELRCCHPVVNAKDSFALSTNGPFVGTSCMREREGGWFSACGLRGKLWEAK